MKTITLNKDGIIEAAKELIESADNTGCTEDLTVVSADALGKLQSAVSNVIMERDRLLEENKNLKAQVQSLLDVPEADAVKAQACRIRDLVSENVKLQRQVDALQHEKVRELWGVLNSVRTGLKMCTRELDLLDDLRAMLPRMDEVLSALQEKE